MLPEELEVIHNPDVLNDYLKKYSLYTIEIDNKKYDVYLNYKYDYLFKNGEFIAAHNVTEYLALKRKYKYMTFCNEWTFQDINDIVSQCDKCKSFNYGQNCNKCDHLLVDKSEIEDKYLWVPISTSEEKIKTKIYVDDEILLDFEIGNDLRYHHRYSYDISKHLGKTLTIVIDTTDINPNLVYKYLNLFTYLDSKQYHGYTHDFRLNHEGHCRDINGLVYWNGLFHMFFQHDPAMLDGDNAFWGYTTSIDLINWSDYKVVLRPFIDCDGQCFSGSGNVIDDTMFFALTDTTSGERLVIYENGNFVVKEPVILKHFGRDPKIIRYNNYWIMIVSEITDFSNCFYFHKSYDLYNWEYLSQVDNMFECPEMIRFNVNGEEKWVLFECCGNYRIGSFNGIEFIQDIDQKYRSHFGIFYASQCFTNYHKNIQIGCLETVKHGYFKNTFSIPLELNLVKENENYVLEMVPIIKEVIECNNPEPNCIYINGCMIIHIDKEDITIEGNKIEFKEDIIIVNDKYKMKTKKDLEYHEIVAIIDTYTVEFIIDKRMYFSNDRSKTI